MSESTQPELHGHCPVAYLAAGQPMQGDPRFSSRHKGKLYYFVNADVQREFERDPEKYLPAFDGQCAFGMSIDKEFEGSPSNFKIIDGKLHLFLKNDETDALALWNQADESRSLANANQNWNARHGR